MNYFEYLSQAWRNGKYATVEGTISKHFSILFCGPERQSTPQITAKDRSPPDQEITLAVSEKANKQERITTKWNSKTWAELDPLRTHNLWILSTWRSEVSLCVCVCVFTSFFSSLVPQQQPISPLMIWMALNIICRELTASRVTNSAMLNFTTLWGSVHTLQELELVR